MSQAYIAAIERWFDAQNRRIVKAVFGAAQEIHANIVNDTPIDTGRAKSSWNMVNSHQADLSVTPLLADRRNIITGAIIERAADGAAPLSAGQALAAAQASLQNLTSDAYLPVVKISNNLDYIVSLENGASNQSAPGQMFNQNVRDGQFILERHAKAS